MPEWKPLTTAELNTMWFKDEGAAPFVDAPSKLIALLTEAFPKKNGAISDKRDALRTKPSAAHLFCL